MLDRFVSLGDVVAGARLFAGLPRFLRHPTSLSGAREELRRRLERRVEAFLELVRTTIFENPRSPYQPLLTVAGCEYGDLERMARRDGVEGALQTLLHQGVYVTLEEFKGQRPAVRSGRTIDLRPKAFYNPRSAFHVAAQTGGSRGVPLPVHIDLAFLRDAGVNECLNLAARNGLGWSHALWEVPGGAATAQILLRASFGAPPARWFSQVDARRPELHARYRMSARVMWAGGLLGGVRLPLPEHVSLDNPAPILAWIRAVRESGGTPHLKTYGSSAVRLCQSALAAGADLTGFRLSVSGEPISETRLEIMRKTGAMAVPRAGSRECGAIGYGCLEPTAADDLHVLLDLNAFVQPGRAIAGPDLPEQALFVTSLRHTAPLVLLNVSLGDQSAPLVHRRCGCPLEAFGWTLHMHTLRSHRKLTSGGMSALDAQVVRVIDEVLPARFGGAPTDYQLWEEHMEDGSPRLRLLVSPAVGPLDAQAVIDVFLAAVGAGAESDRITSLLWRDAGMLRVERRTPLASGTGKIQHFHSARSRVAPPAFGSDVPGEPPTTRRA